jgi:hypothetical protein
MLRTIMRIFINIVYILKTTNVNQLSGITSIQKKEFRVLEAVVILYSVT